MTGYVIRKGIGKKSNIKGSILVLLGIGIEIIVVYSTYILAQNGIGETDLKYKLTAPHSPFITLASILIFWGFSFIEIKKNWGKVASRMFLVYLIHAGILDVCGEIVRQLLGVRMFDNRVVILVNTVLAFTGSYILSGMYTLIWRCIDQRTKITERLCNIMHLA